MTDKDDDDMELKRYYPRAISPLSTPEEKAAFRLKREEELRDIIKGPAPTEDWHLANEELRGIRTGRFEYDEDEWRFGR
ncbi:MAG: hypothetical protein KDA57_10425 [Planctomycetales bacterium]|nr:hypothetical protein [Planctomycetales bacterium]